MDRIKKIKQKEPLRTDRSILLSFVYSLIISLIVLFVFCIITFPDFECKDDQWMIQLVERIHKNSDGLLIFQNVVYNKMLIALYNICDSVNWYVIVQLLFVLISIGEVSYIVLRKSNSAIGIMLFAIVPLISYCFIHCFEFTRIAALVSISGIVLLFYGLECKIKKEKIIVIVIGSITLLFGSWFRFDAMNMVALMLSVIGVAKVIEICADKSFASIKIKLKQIAVYIIVFFIAFSIPFSFNVINSNYYSSDNLNNYSEFNSLRSKMLDSLTPSFADNKEMYESLGISEHDLEFYETWNFDLSVLTNDNMKIITEGKVYKNTINDAIYYCKYVLINNLLKSPYFWVFALLCVLAILSDKKKILYVILQSIILFTVLFYLQWRLRAVDRVVIGVYFSAIIAMLCSIDCRKLSKLKLFYKKRWIKNSFCICMSCVALFSCTIVAYKLYDYEQNVYPELVETRKMSKSFYEEIAKDTDNLYATDETKINYFLLDAYGVYETAKKGSLDNIVSCGGWYLNWPSTLNVYERYGVDNIYIDCINNDHIFFVLNDESLIERYIQENYNPKAHLVLDRMVGEQGIYKVVA